ncbi:MAG: hypothetical protein A3D87_04310 [Omnitrophica WOR_2 bacterium RIFCSPHIGHO2_02_FULL_50_17]|nr:MAG: hypothetical protein A3D87_04310 [Omnitrophica WOR_2 bacterium RIFCSPHIGHO2_02_FULL_50_17]
MEREKEEIDFKDYTHGNKKPSGFAGGFFIMRHGKLIFFLLFFSLFSSSPYEPSFNEKFFVPLHFNNNIPSC